MNGTYRLWSVKAVALALFVSLALAPPVLADYEDVVAAIERGQYATALKFIPPIASAAFHRARPFADSASETYRETAKYAASSSG